MLYVLTVINETLQMADDISCEAGMAMEAMQNNCRICQPSFAA